MWLWHGKIGNNMDKKDKKRLEILRQKADKTQQLIVAAKAQLDDPKELIELQQQLAAFQAEIAELKQK